MDKRKLSEWRKEGFPKRLICHFFGFDKIPVEWESCETCEMTKDCAEWSHFWDFFPMYLEAETEPCGIDQYESIA